MPSAGPTCCLRAISVGAAFIPIPLICGSVDCAPTLSIIQAWRGVDFAVALPWRRGITLFNRLEREASRWSVDELQGYVRRHDRGARCTDVDSKHDQAAIEAKTVGQVPESLLLILVKSQSPNWVEYRPVQNQR